MKYFYFSLIIFFLSCKNVLSQNNVFQWGQFERYKIENKELVSTKQIKEGVVFMGNSITENWYKIHPNFFIDNNYIGRGISGQTSYQFLLRFRQDVISIHPEIVVINAGTNDIAENTGPYEENYTFGNIVSMVELAKANKIKVILTSVLPAASFGWNKSIKDVKQKIISLNNLIKQYAQKNKIEFVNYYEKMVYGENGELNPNYTKDGVHPTGEGYMVMEDMIKKAIDKVK